MRVVVFGATGPTGQLVAQKALDNGHEVTVYVRNPAKLLLSDERIKVVQGELSDVGTMADAITGQDAVISVLGPPPKKTNGQPITAGTKAMIAAMKTHGLARLIAASTPSVADPADSYAFPFWLAVQMIRTFQRHAYDDIIGTGGAIKASGLDWTLVRIPLLTSKESPLPPAVGHVGTAGVNLLSLSRNVLADFFVNQLTDKTWVRQSPLVSNGR